MEIYTRTSQSNPDVEILLQDFEMYGIRVPAGFEFDGASAPRIFWNIIPPFKRTKKAACIHDWLCKEAKSKEDRKRADKLFYRALRDAGLSEVRSRIGYIGVRIGALIGIGVYY